MPAFNHKIQELNGASNKIVLFRRAADDNKSAPDPSDVKQIISMFSIENKILRRKNSTLPWNDYNNKIMERRSIFQIESGTNFGNDSEVPINKTLNKPSNPITNAFYGSLEQYLGSTTLHGLKYVGDSSISIGERLFWLCSFICAIAFAGYFISNIFYRYSNSPVIISVNPTPTKLNTLPFPAITICNMNQAKKNEAETILQTGTDVERMLLDDYCKLNASLEISNFANEEVAKWLNVQKFMLQVSQPCPEMIKVCLFKDDEVDCNFIFNSALTDEGLCCTFNQLPRGYIFRNPRDMNDLNLTYPSKVEDWNPERGYLKNASEKAIPFKAAGAGTRLGLTVVLDAAIQSYYCSSTNSIGFKVLLHNPIETPKMADFAFLLPPGVEARIEITPKMYDATPTLNSIDVSKRLCFFIEERQLRFYRSYTQRNCNLECQANYTLELCGCVPYYLPKSRVQKICGKKEESCIKMAKNRMDNISENRFKKELDKCNCLPGCFELNYQTTTSYGKLSGSIRIREDIIKNETLSYFKENMVVAHFFFVDTQFSRNTKSEIYGFSEFLSNTGGLLGLFMGFSFLSAVEIAYYLSLRIFCCLLRKNKQEKKIRSMHPKHNQSIVYPFAK